MATIEKRVTPARTVTDRRTGKDKRLPAMTRWDVRWRDAESKSRRKTFTTERDAKVFKKTVEDATRQGVDTSAKAQRTTLAEYADSWLASGHLSSRTVALYRLTLSTVPFRDKPLASITATDLRGWLVGLGKDGRPGVDRQGRPANRRALAVGTRRMHAARLRALLDAAVEDRLLSATPYSAKAVRQVLGGRTADSEAVAVERLPGDDVVAALIGAMQPRYRVGLVLAAYCGLRSGEIRALQLRDFDHLHRRLHVRASMVRERQADGSPEVRGELKTTASRTKPGGMPLSPAVADLIQDHVARFCPEPGNPDASLMPTERGGHVDANTFGHFFRQARKRVGAGQVRLHDLRHYGVSAQIRAGATVAEAQAFARHASARMTLDTYTHAFADAEDNNAERMGQVFALVSGASS